MKIGSDDISKIYLGSEEISKIYLGSEVIYEAEVEPTPTGPVFNINPNYNYTITGDEIDFFNGNSSVTVLAPSNRSPAFNIICDDWSKVNSITVTSITPFMTNNYGYYDANKGWHSLGGSGAVTFSNNNRTATFNLTDTIRNDIYYIYLDCGHAGTQTTYSNFSYT